MVKILIADDERQVCQKIRAELEQEGYAVEEAASGEEVVARVLNNTCEALVMDTGLPDMDGFRVLFEIRKKKSIPVILLSDIGDEYERIRGLEAGADDFLVKPISARELRLRLRLIMGRRNDSGDGEEGRKRELFRYQGLLIDFAARRLSVDGTEKRLTRKSWELLLYLFRNKNLLLSREQLITTIWGYDYFGDDRTLDTHIKLLRTALGPYRKHIATVRGEGYKFEVL